jgi:hypothetical protein
MIPMNEMTIKRELIIAPFVDSLLSIHLQTGKRIKLISTAKLRGMKSVLP